MYNNKIGFREIHSFELPRVYPPSSYSSFVSFSLETAIACSHYILIILITINAYLINLRHHAVRQYAFNTNTNKSYLNNRSKSIIAVYGYYPFFFYFFPSPFLLLPPSPFFFTNVSERCRNYLKYICIDDNHRY